MNIDFGQEAADFFFIGAVLRHRDAEISLAILLHPVFHRLEPGEHKKADSPGGKAKARLASAETQAHDGKEPQGGSRGDAGHEIVAAHDGSRADESHAGEDAQRQTHEVVHHEGIGSPARKRQQEIDLQHCNTGGDADQDRRPQAGGAAVLAAVQSEKGAYSHRASKAQGNFGPGKHRRHIVFSRRLHYNRTGVNRKCAQRRVSRRTKG